MNFYDKLDEMKAQCLTYFEDLCKRLENTHVLVGSCNQDETLYLVPKGTEDQITYNSKPANSYRYSDHWNWYANVKKCKNPNYIQCLNVDLPWAKKRLAKGKASKPIWGVQVAYCGEDGKYHHVFGEKFNRTTKEWTFE